MERSPANSLFKLHAAPASSPEIRPGLLYVSTAAGDFLAAQAKSGISKGTLAKYRQGIWSLIEFLGGDYPTQELIKKDLTASWSTWLRETPAAPRRPGTLPKEITPDTVRSFLATPPPRAKPGEFREQTVGSYFCYARKFLARLGCEVELSKQDRPNLALPPPLVPTPAIVRDWWSGYLRDNRPRTQRVVLMQAFLLLTGMRLGEALRSAPGGSGGSLALGSRHQDPQAEDSVRLSPGLGHRACFLRTRYTNPLLFADAGEQLVGWPHTAGYWHACAKAWTNPDQKNTELDHRNQAMRRICSTFLYRRNPTAESLQLGHGSGVVLRHYVDAMRMVPPLLEKFPLLGGERIGFEWPEPITASKAVPARLYAEFRKLSEPPADRTAGMTGMGAMITMAKTREAPGLSRRPRVFRILSNFADGGGPGPREFSRRDGAEWGWPVGTRPAAPGN